MMNASLYRRTMRDIGKALREAKAQGLPVPFRRWDRNGDMLVAGERVFDGKALYRVKRDHTTRPDWPPGRAPDLYARVLIPISTIIFDWEQPDNDNGYMIGNRVRHCGRIWQSIANDNNQEPGTPEAEDYWVDIA